MKFTPMLKMDQVKEGDAPNPPAAKPPEQPNAPAGNPPAQEGGDNTDEFGYEKTPAAAAPENKSGDKPPEAPPEKPEEVDPTSGYGAEPAKVEDPPAPKDGEKPPAAPPAQTDIDKAIGDGIPKDESDRIKAFAEKHKLSPEQVKAYADDRREELKAAQKYAEQAEERDKADAERARLKQRGDWYNELKTDKDFGGANFDKNTKLVDRVLNDFMPSTKKRLTESKGMLAPYLMRDLKALGEKLYANETLVNGNPPVPKVDDKESNDPLAFYNNP
jgi:hypothetical protein